MAEQLDDFEFRPHSSAYPWEDWTNGAVWRITQGVDFEVTPRNMQSQLYIRARKARETERKAAEASGTADGEVHGKMQVRVRLELGDNAEDEPYNPTNPAPPSLVFQFYRAQPVQDHPDPAPAPRKRKPAARKR